MTPERQAEPTAVACKQVGQQFPMKTSYMFCDMLDIRFFYGPGGTTQVAYAGYTTAASADFAEGKLVEAFRKVDIVLRPMRNLAEEAKQP